MIKSLKLILNKRLHRRLIKRGCLRLGENARLATSRILIRGSGGMLNIGKNSLVSAALTLERSGAVISIGDRTFVGGSHLIAAGEVSVGNDVMISWGCTITDHNSHSIRFSERQNDVLDWAQGKKDWSRVAVRKVVIGDKAWLGFNVIVLKGVEIGEGAIVGAGSVVTKNVPPWTIVAGNPAKVLREIDPSER